MKYGSPALLVALLALAQALGCSARSRPADAIVSLPIPTAESAPASATSSPAVPAGGSLAAPRYGVEKTGFVQPAVVPLPPVNGSPPAESVPKGPQVPGELPIDLSTALRLADAENPQVAFAREQVRQALARVEGAQSLWLPSLRGGLNYDRHEGAIQQVLGQQSDTSRSAFYAGAGAWAYGAASPSVPGIYANFQLADAIFQPLAARQFASAQRNTAAAASHDTLLQVALAYLEVLRAAEDFQIALAIRDDAARLVDITTAYADSGEGLRSDANRSRTELAIRRNDVGRAEESVRVAAARLAQLLRLDPTLVLRPLEPAIVPVDLVNADAPARELIADGLAHRPELSASRSLVAEAQERLRRELYAPLVPSVILGASYGGMGAGQGSSLAPFSDRLDLDAIAYWEMRNLGFGDQAARDNARSTVMQARIREVGVMDQVAREIVEAQAQVQIRRREIAIAREAVEAANASERQNLERIQGAKGLPIEALQSIQALAQARREYLRVVIDYNAAQFTLYRALGWPAGCPADVLAKSPAKAKS